MAVETRPGLAEVPDAQHAEYAVAARRSRKIALSQGIGAYTVLSVFAIILVLTAVSFWLLGSRRRRTRQA